MLGKIKYILDVPKTIYFNLKVLPFKLAVRLPFFISHKFSLQIEDYKAVKINVAEERIKPFIIRFSNGGSEDIIPRKYGLIKVDRGSQLIFEGQCQFCAGCSLRVATGGVLRFGNNFNANRNCNISCFNSISIGEDSLFGFYCSVCDSDGHNIIRKGVRSINNKSITIGRHVWLCANVSIGKGSSIGANSVVGANSNIIGKFGEGKLIIGSPGKEIEDNLNWEI